jgi:hypothetical protein
MKIQEANQTDTSFGLMVIWLFIDGKKEVRNYRVSRRFFKSIRNQTDIKSTRTVRWLLPVQPTVQKAASEQEQEQ